MNWIKVKDALPKEGEPVIAYGCVDSRRDGCHDESPVVHHARFEGKYWWSPTGNCYEDGGPELHDVTHWMPLPEPPDEPGDFLDMVMDIHKEIGSLIAKFGDTGKDEQLPTMGHREPKINQ